MGCRALGRLVAPSKARVGAPRRRSPAGRHLSTGAPLPPPFPCAGPSRRIAPPSIPAHAPPGASLNSAGVSELSPAARSAACSDGGPHNGGCEARGGLQRASAGQARQGGRRRRAAAAALHVCPRAAAHRRVPCRFADSQTGVDLNNVKMSMNPFCEVRCQAGSGRSGCCAAPPPLARRLLALLASLQAAQRSASATPASQAASIITCQPQIAVEEALRVKEAKLADEVVAVSIGPKQVRPLAHT